MLLLRVESYLSRYVFRRTHTLILGLDFGLGKIRLSEQLQMLPEEMIAHINSYILGSNDKENISFHNNMTNKPFNLKRTEKNPIVFFKKADPGSIAVSESELNLNQTFRNTR